MALHGALCRGAHTHNRPSHHSMRCPQAALTREEAKLRQRSLDKLGAPPFGQVLKVRAGGS